LPEDNTIIELGDLIQEGIIGLCEAKESFKPDRGVKFFTYAITRIRGAIIDFLRKQDWLPQKQRKKLEEYKQAKEELLQRLQRELTRKEIAEELGIPEEEVRAIEELQIFLVSLDEPCFTDDGTEIYISDTIHSGTKPPDTKIKDEEIVEAVNLCVEGLPSPEKEIIEERYWKKKTLKEVAESLNMTIPTVQRREKEAERQLKDCMEKKGWSIEYIP
jgi:RNA polymerase sigma factor for flagellar operon FliA